MAAGKKHGYDLVISGEPAMWFMRQGGDENMEVHQAWVAENVKRGVFYANHHNLFINAALTDADIAYSIEVADEAFAAIAARGIVPAGTVHTGKGR